MKTNTKRLALVAVTAAAIAGYTATSAQASTVSFTVTAGSAASGSVNVTGVTTGSTPQIRFTDTSTGVAFTCDSGTAPGTVVVGGHSYTSPATSVQVGAITGGGTTWTNCQGDGFNFTVAGSGSWPVNASMGTSTGVSGTISGVNASVTGTGIFGTTCNFTVTGSVPTSYTNTDHTLHVTAGTGLQIATASGTCASLGAVNGGDSATFVADYSVTANTSADNPVQITSP